MLALNLQFPDDFFWSVRIRAIKSQLSPMTNDPTTVGEIRIFSLEVQKTKTIKGYR